MKLAALLLAASFVLATVLPLVPSEYRWIRIFDFPRLQIAVGLVVSAVFLLALGANSARDIAMLLIVLVALVYQGFLIFRYTPLYPIQAATAEPGGTDACLKLLISNVLMENREADGLLRLIEEKNPDIALLVETDDWWAEALAPLSKTYPHTVLRPQDNHYGMLLYSRLPLVDPELRFLIHEDIPSIRTGVELASGKRIVLYGLHPVPPPLADTEMRDAEILVVAKEARESETPIIVAGDLNDVSWSHTTRMFTRISGLLDPRIGRGMFASFNAKNPVMRWPLDHIFHDAEFKVREVRLLPGFGSDHFPVYVDLCHQPDVPAAETPPRADRSELKEANEKIEEGKEAEPAEDDYPQPDTLNGKD